MSTCEQLRHDELLPQAQHLAEDAKHATTISREIRDQHEVSTNIEQNATQMEVETDHETTVMLSESTSVSDHRRYSGWQSLGLISTCMLIFTTMVIIVSFFILIVLWKGAEDSINHKTPKLLDLWVSLVFRDWTTRAITICSAAIRTSISLQIGVLVSASAAIILEVSGTRMLDIPVLSVERMQSNPISILPAVLGQTMNSASGALHSLIIVTTVMILLSSNLNSTILLSDLGIAQIPAPPVTNDTAISYSDVPRPADPTVISWKISPPAQWRFAETRVGESRFGDTGRVYRAFLPFQDETKRASLEYYSGPATVANARTICVPMQLGEFRIESDGLRPFVDSAPSLWLRERTRNFTFECATIPRIDYDGPGWATTLCSGEPRYNEHEFLDELNNDKAMLLENEEYSMHKIIILNTTADIESLFEEERIVGAKPPKQLGKLSAKPEGLWTRIYDSIGDEMMAATCCYYNVRRPGIYNVTLTGNAVPKEPHWNHDTAGSGVKYTADLRDKTNDILFQFSIGVDIADTAKRGILKLDVGPLTDKKNSFPPYKVGLVAPEEEYLKIGPLEYPLLDLLNEKTIASNTTWDMSGDNHRDPWAVHKSHSIVFQSILQQTGDPAIAVQSILTRLHQVVYYGQMDKYDLVYPVTTMHLATRIIPVQWLGLCIIIGMTITHLIQVFAVILIFLSTTRLSALGNAWQAVAQATHATKALESAESDLDKEVGKWAKANGHTNDIYVLSPVGQDGNMELRLKQRKGRD